MKGTEKNWGHKLTKLIVVGQWVEDMETGPFDYFLQPTIVFQPLDQILGLNLGHII
jgi:hypothetical protein